MKSKRYLKSFYLLAMTLLIAILMTACSSSKKENVEAEQPSSENATKLTENDPGWQEDNSPITFDWYINFSWFASKWGGDETSKYITDKTGVTLNIMAPAGNEAEKMNTMIASGKLPDFITLAWGEEAVKQMVEGELVLPLNDLAEQYDPYFFKVADPAKLAWYRQENGNVYGYPNASSSPKTFDKYKDLKPSNQTFLVRKDMYEAIGSPDMRTPEGFLQALKDAKEKFPDVNGTPLIPLGLHEFGDTGNYSLEGYLQNFLAIPMEKDGELYDRSTDPEYIRWLKVLRQANEDGLLAKDIFIDKRPQMEEKIAQGRYFAMLYQRSDMEAQELARYQNDPDSVYIAVDGPANENLDPPTLSGDGLSGWTITLISKDVKDPARAIQFMSYLISEEGQRDMYLGPEGVTYEDVDGKPQWFPEVLDLLHSDRTAFDQKYGASNTFWMLMDTDMLLEWQPPTEEPMKQLEDWTKGKTESFAVFDDLNPQGTSSEGVANGKIAQEWGKTLPKMILAKSDKEFDEAHEEFLKKRDKLGYEKVHEYQQKRYEENKTKIENAMEE
ncbi:ABC transporter substrate-binding protein [Bacillus sp. J14TS2]|uniref:extracellular solute-binding protein n=1 Tax=Bacillus sp. J14TS2 TaxID=2807188 RepID=UPI001B09820B|nr:extracellular solute-binding protein [Bacillus sp. J14TS2]GIN69722.1 ABC transporter substrate-binding protein [Bacillus sp. J14TS2]